MEQNGAPQLGVNSFRRTLNTFRHLANQIPELRFAAAFVGAGLELYDAINHFRAQRGEQIHVNPDGEDHPVGPGIGGAGAGIPRGQEQGAVGGGRRGLPADVPVQIYLGNNGEIFFAVNYVHIQELFANNPHFQNHTGGVRISGPQNNNNNNNNNVP